MPSISFGSDNHSGAHPLILQAIGKANSGYWHGYGEEDYTEKVQKKVASLFGKNASALFVITGTGANVLALQSLVKSYEAILCAETAHINMHEAGAVQKITQARLLVFPTPDGKLTPKILKPHLDLMTDQHMSQPRVISISQPTEYGTVYTLKELKELADFAHSHNLFLQVDGARLANAAVSLNCSLEEMTSGCSVDVVSLGGTKNGCLFGEAVIFINQPEAAKTAVYYRKQMTQLLSKMRYLTLQMEAYITDELWRKNAAHSNLMAQLLRDKLAAIPQIKITQPVQSNFVFVILPPEIIPVLQERYYFYLWNEPLNEVRLLCSWDTTEEMLDEFVRDLKSLI
ncbi:MAG TPA: low specificity L-threonine aldolase [Candidatus Cloacimonadota bacterium]|nr:low specificity L-threonine aldolase [Candidatus Cloacimonadota bacterium]HQL14682.1 low specificity L-threonine aldolase [Candidatus Cloacimonadota bacterium]